MGLLDIFRRGKADATETRATGTGYTSMILAARQSYIAGGSDVAELTSVVQSCVSLWEQALAGADVEGTNLLPRSTMAILGRSLALRGEFVGMITGDGILPCSDWELSTRGGIPRAYRVSVAEAGGSTVQTALAGEVLHVRIGSDSVAPWTGSAPLHRASLSANLLHEIETALRDVYRTAPIGSQVLPLPDGSPGDMVEMRQALKGRRGSTLIVEGASQAAAAGMAVQQGQQRHDLTPALDKAQVVQTMAAAQGSIAMAFGVLPALFNPAVTGPVVRESQRNLGQWVLEPICKLISDEASAKLDAAIKIDCIRPLQAYDQGAKARSFAALVRAMAEAKAAGIDPAPLLHMLDHTSE